MPRGSAQQVSRPQTRKRGLGIGVEGGVGRGAGPRGATAAEYDACRGRTSRGAGPGLIVLLVLAALPGLIAEAGDDASTTAPVARRAIGRRACDGRTRRPGRGGRPGRGRRQAREHGAERG